MSCARLLLLLSACPSAAAEAAGPQFTITDEMAKQEVSETTSIYLDGKLLGEVHLDSKVPTRTIIASVPDGADRHQYALCGEITVRRADGQTETHEVNSGGFISDVDGRAYQALGASDFTFFYLSDDMPGRALAMPVRGRSVLCHPPVS